MKLWEKGYARAHLKHKATRIQKITTGRIGKPIKRCLGLKAAETTYFFYFSAKKVQRVKGMLHQGGVWADAAVAMENLMRTLGRTSWKLTEVQEQEHTWSMPIIT